MGWFNTKKTITKSDGDIPAKAFITDFLTAIGGNSSVKWDINKLQYLKYYLEVPEVAAVINIKARARAKVKWEVLSKSNDQPVKNNDPIVRTLRQPNYFQSQKEFIMQSVLFKEIFGNEFIYFLSPAAMSSNIKGMFTIPPMIVDIEETRTPAFWLQSEMPDTVKYTAKWGGQIYPLENNSLIHINNSNVQVRNGNMFLGESPMRSLGVPIRNIIAAYEARNVLIENRGALGILTNNSTDGIGSTLPLDQKEKEKLQEDYQARYGLTKSKWQMIITSLNLKWQQMAVDIDKLKLFEETKADTERICDAYGVPFELLANEKGVTFDNKKTAEKGFYLNTIIPEAEEQAGALNRYFETMNKSWYLRASFDHLDIFQENKKERAQSVTLIINGLSKAFQDGAITIDQYKEELTKMGVGDGQRGN